MKNKYLLSVCAILLGFVFSTSVKAQIINESNGKVVWLGSTLNEALNGQYVYLYQVNEDMFVNAGGSYGVQGVLSTVGMRLKIESYNGNYRVASRIDNQAQGNYMSPNQTTGSEIYLDRVGVRTTGNKYSDPDWRFTVHTTSQTINGISYPITSYTIQNVHRNSYLSYNGNNLVFGSETQWRIVTEADYVEAMNNVVWGEVDLGSFVQDAEFGRDNMDGRYWVWEGDGVTTGTDEQGTYTKDTEYTVGTTPTHWHQRNQDKMVNGLVLNENVAAMTIPVNTVGSNVISSAFTGQYAHDSYRNACAKYYAAEIYNEKIKLSQTAELSTSTQGSNLTEGLYKMTCQALYYDDAQGLTNDDVAYFFVTRTANGETTTESLPIIPMNKVDNNITAHSGVSAGYVFDHNANAYLLEFFIEVKAGTTLTFGIDMQKAEGWAVIGNIHLYAHGKQAIFLDEDWSTSEKIKYTLYEDDTNIQESEAGDPYTLVRYNEKYDWPVSLYYQRTMTKDKWNTICLPINLTGSQVRQTFGNDCELAEIDELEVVESNNATGGHYTIHFKGVDLDTEGLIFGKPYIIKPTIDPQDPDGTKVEVGNGGQNQFIVIEGPTYILAGVKKEALLENQVLANLAQTATGNTYSTYSKPINFTGTFYRKEFTANQVKDGDDHMWFITKGNMYHLQGTRAVTLWATYAYLHAPKESLDANISNISISLDGITDTMTSIDEMPILREGNMDDAAIYNLSGQRIEGKSLSTLPRGIYIVNGRKYTVK